MSDVFAEVTRFTVVLLLWLALLRRTWAINAEQPKGWRYILWGFFLLVLGSAIDITDEFESLARFVVIGDTPLQAFIEKIVCSLGGYGLLLIGFHHWLPVVMRAQQANRQLAHALKKGATMQTQLLAQNRQLKMAQEAAQEAYSLQSQFIANVSHNLRTPVHALQAYAELGLESAAAHSRARDYFARIHGSAGRLNTLVDDLLDIAKLEAGKTDLRVENADWAALINGVLTDEAPLLHQQGLRVSVRVQTQDPCADVDSGALQKVLHNLIANVIHHAASGAKFELSLFDARLNDRPALALSCRDWGPGIEACRLGLVFNKFVQAKNRYSNHPGTGLGLAICKALIALHGGEIRAENHPSGGAVLTLILYRQIVAGPGISASGITEPGITGPSADKTVTAAPSGRSPTHIPQGGSRD